MLYLSNFLFVGKMKPINKNKEKKNKVTLMHSCAIRTLYQFGGVRGKKLLNMFPRYSKSTIYEHAVKSLNEDPVEDKRKNNKGRPSKLSAWDNSHHPKAAYK